MEILNKIDESRVLTRKVNTIATNSEKTVNTAKPNLKDLRQPTITESYINKIFESRMIDTPVLSNKVMYNVSKVIEVKSKEPKEVTKSANVVVTKNYTKRYGNNSQKVTNIIDTINKPSGVYMNHATNIQVINNNMAPNPNPTNNIQTVNNTLVPNTSTRLVTNTIKTDAFNTEIDRGARVSHDVLGRNSNNNRNKISLDTWTSYRGFFNESTNKGNLTSYSQKVIDNWILRVEPVKVSQPVETIDQYRSNVMKRVKSTNDIPNNHRVGYNNDKLDQRVTRYQI